MKIAVILGILQMSMGIFMKAFNSIYFRKWIDFIFEFLPQIILLWVLFGWMDVLIIGKWLTDYGGHWQQRYAMVGGTRKLIDFDATGHSPQIISTMIDMFLDVGGAPNNYYVFDSNLAYVENDPNNGINPNSVQKSITFAFLIIAIITVPTMLCVKPLYLNSQHKRMGHIEHKRASSQVYQQLQNDDMNTGGLHQSDKKDQTVEIAEILEREGEGDGAHSFGDIFIHQMIETIEFVLGTISNTASYLRLWALSLAHSELGAVFYDETIGNYVKNNDPMGTKIGWIILWYFVWASATFFVLICMDAMECFLHTLRLHWVEFQNKFYKGSGYKFTPFSYETVLEAEMNR